MKRPGVKGLLSIFCVFSTCLLDASVNPEKRDAVLFQATHVSMPGDPLRFFGLAEALEQPDVAFVGVERIHIIDHDY